MKRMCVIAAALALSACVAVKQTALPDGSRGYSLDCRGLLSFADCMNKAAQICGGPYHILDQERESTPFNVAGKNMLVSCVNPSQVQYQPQRPGAPDSTPYLHEK